MEIKKTLTENFYKTKYNHCGLVLHTTLGSLKGTLSWLRSKRSSASAHFVIDRLGDVYQLVEIKDGAWHCGRIYNPSEVGKTLLKKNIWGSYVNPNKYLVGIEFVCGYDIDKDGTVEGWEKLYTPQQIKACADLIIKYIEPEIKIPLVKENIITHKDITSYKPDLALQRVMVLNELNKRRKEIAGEIIGITTNSEDENIKIEEFKVPLGDYNISQSNGKLIYRSINNK